MLVLTLAVLAYLAGAGATYLLWDEATKLNSAPIPLRWWSLPLIAAWLPMLVAGGATALVLLAYDARRLYPIAARRRAPWPAPALTWRETVVRCPHCHRKYPEA